MTLPPIYDSVAEPFECEAELMRVFREVVYLPLLEELDIADPEFLKLNNAKDKDASQLTSAISSQRVQYSDGKFTGRFNSSISKELSKLGGKFKKGAWVIAQGLLPKRVLDAINLSDAKFKETLDKIDARLAKTLPEEVAAHVKTAEIFDRALWKTDEALRRSLKDISVVPNITPEQRAKIAEDYTNNMRLFVKDWTEQEIKNLRQKVRGQTFSGGRYESLIKQIQDSYTVSASKARFLARQETKLLVSTFKEARYTEAGIKKYRWECVAGSKYHPVRPMHLALKGRVFSWDNPPVVNENGERKNPGQDFGCRCIARPIVEFKTL